MARINFSNFIILFILIAIALILFVLYPQYIKFSNLQKIIEIKKSNLESRENYYKELESDLEKLNSYQDKLSKIDSALPKENSFPSFFNSISKIAQTSAGLLLKEIKSIESLESKDIIGLKENKTKFIVSGFYAAFKNFISSLEKSARLIQIETISSKISPEIKEKILPGQELIYDLNVEVKFYSY